MTQHLQAKINGALFAKVRDCAKSIDIGNEDERHRWTIAIECLLKSGLDSLLKKSETVVETPTCPSCDEPLAAVYYLCKKEQKIIRGDYWDRLIKDAEELATSLSKS